MDSMLDDMAREHGEVVALKACDVLGGRGGIGENCKKKKNFGLLVETDMNEVSVRSSSNPMSTGQRYGGKDILLPFESRHYSHQ